MEQAAEGTEVLVSKRGRPFVRLLGTQDPPEAATAAGSEAPLGFPADAG